jgi:tetratricopeptide (TPR) repeat protein
MAEDNLFLARIKLDIVSKRIMIYFAAVVLIASAVQVVFAADDGWAVNVGSFDRSSVPDMFPVPTETAVATEGTVDFNTNTGSAAEIRSLHLDKSERDNDAGLAYMHAWDYDRAIACFEDALNEDPENIQASFNLEKAKSEVRKPKAIAGEPQATPAAPEEISVTKSADSGWAAALQKALEGEVK